VKLVLLRIWNLVLQELIQSLRDWLMTAFILTLPALQLALLAQATGSGIAHLDVAVLDLDRSTASRRLAVALDNRRELDVRYHPAALSDARDLLDRGQVTLAVVISPGFAADLADASCPPSIQLIVDASNTVPASNALRAARGAVAAFAEGSRFSGTWSQDPTSVVELRTTVHFNPTLDFRYFSIPAQVGFIVYQVTLTVSSVGLARERELGTLEQLMVMPLRRVELVIGKAIPALIIGALNFGLMLAVAVWGFGVPLRGSLLLLFLLTLLFVVVEIGYGILISGLARTQQQAILLVFVLAMVDMTFSGYMVRVKHLPALLRAVAQVVPFRHYLVIIRGVMLKGSGLGALWPHAAAMGLMGILVMLVAVRSLSRSLD
jgi:ABC-2 type transport system permease protein